MQTPPSTPRLRPVQTPKRRLSASPPRGRSATPPRRSRLATSRATPPCKFRPATSLRFALQKRSLRLAQQALAHDKLAAVEPSREPALLLAVRCGCSADILRLLLNNGADVNGADADGVTPLTALACAPKEQVRDWINVDLKAVQHLVRDLEVDKPASGAAVLNDALCCELASVLLAYGADCSRTGSAAVSAAELAQRNERDGLAVCIWSWRNMQDTLGLCDPVAAIQAEELSAGTLACFGSCAGVDHPAHGA